MAAKAITFVTEFPAEVAADPRVRRVVLAGGVVFFSLQKEEPPFGFTSDDPRELARGFLQGWTRKTERMFVYIDQRATELSRLRVAYAVDGYLKWGGAKARKGTTVLFGGGETESASTIQVLVFTSGILAAVQEHQLSAPSSPQFERELDALISDWRGLYPNARFVQASPLTSWDREGIEYVGDKALVRLSYQRLTIGSAKRQSNLLLPACVVAGGLAVAIGMAWTGWASFESAGARFNSAKTDPLILQQGGVDASALERATSRKSYMEAERQQTTLINVAGRVAQAVGAMRPVKIVELAVPAPNMNSDIRAVGLSIDPADATARGQLSAERVPDVRMVLAVPRDAALTGLGQAQQVLTSLAGSTGMSLRLAQQGLRDEGSRRLLTIEGFVHNEAPKK